MGVLGEKRYDNLIVGGEITTDSGVLVSGQKLTRGAVLGKITTSGKLTLSDDGASDGSETPYAILNEDVDATAGDKSCAILLGGEVNSNALTFGGAHTAQNTKDTLRGLGIFLKTSV